MVIFGVGSWIKDSSKREAARLKRDTCQHYGRRSGSCIRYGVICCSTCKKWEQKRDRPKWKEKEKKEKSYIKRLSDKLLGDEENMENNYVGDKNRGEIENKSVLDLSNNVYNRGYFTGESNIGYRYPGYRNFENNINVVTYIISQNPESVIEIGGARGYVTRMLEEKNIKSLCVDVSEYCQETKVTDSFLLYNIINTPLPFTDKQWDLLFTKDLMEHLPESKIDDIIRDMERISNRAIHAITFNDHPTASEDITHTLLRSKEWWINKFKEIVPNYKVEVLDKELFNNDITKTNKRQELNISIGPISEYNKITDISIDTTVKDTVKITGYARTIQAYIPDISVAEVLSNNGKGKLRIALISTPFFGVPPLKYGGLEQIVWDLAEGLDELGHIVTLFAPEGSKTPKHGMLVTTGSAIDTVGVNWFAEEEKRYFKWKDVITNDRYDIVHDHSWFGFPYFHRMNNLKLRVLHTHHGGYTWDTAPPFPKPNLVAISKWMKLYTEQYFKQKGFNIKCEYVYNGIDLNRYSFDLSVKKTDRLLYVGRFSRFKQPDMAIRIAKAVGLSIDLIGGTFVDDMDYLKEIESMCDGENVVMYKDASHEFKIKKLQEAKVLIVPSKMNEPFGLTCIEGMACGTPVIASKDGAIPEIIIDGVTGFVCDNEQKMVDAIGKIDTISSSECRTRAEEFSKRVMAMRYETLYKRIMNGQDW